MMNYVIGAGIMGSVLGVYFYSLGAVPQVRTTQMKREHLSNISLRRVPRLQSARVIAGMHELHTVLSTARRLHLLSHSFYS